MPNRIKMLSNKKVSASYTFWQDFYINILLTVPRRYFFCGSFMFCFLSCVYYVFVRACLYVPCSHLLGKGWPLGSRLWCLTVSLSLSHWYPGSGVVLDCIDSWSLPTSFLLINIKHVCGHLCGIKGNSAYVAVEHVFFHFCLLLKRGIIIKVK